VSVKLLFLIKVQVSGISLSPANIKKVSESSAVLNGQDR